MSFLRRSGSAACPARAPALVVPCLPGWRRWQDAIAYVQRRDGVGTFAEACRRLGASPSELGEERFRAKSARVERVVSALGLRRASELPFAQQLEPTDAWRQRACHFLEECEATLWSAVGARALAYLRGRGLQDHTLRAWRVGFQPTAHRYDVAEHWGLPPQTQDGRRALLWLPRGIVLPWLSDGKLCHLKVRTAASDPDERFRAVRGGHPWLYGAETVRRDRPVVLVEAELCAQLLWQEMGDLVGTASLGGCNRALTEQVLELLAACPAQLLAHDADPEGDKGAERLGRQLPRPHRVRPPGGNDPTAYAQRGGSVRAWLLSELERLSSQEEDGACCEMPAGASGHAICWPNMRSILWTGWRAHRDTTLAVPALWASPDDSIDSSTTNRRQM